VCGRGTPAVACVDVQCMHAHCGNRCHIATMAVEGKADHEGAAARYPCRAGLDELGFARVVGHRVRSTTRALRVTSGNITTSGREVRAAPADNLLPSTEPVPIPAGSQVPMSSVRAWAPWIGGNQSPFLFSPPSHLWPECEKWQHGLCG
jgi:hypothetical protein